MSILTKTAYEMVIPNPIVCLCTQYHHSLPLTKLCSYQIVFHTHPCNPLTFSVKVERNSLKHCVATFCDPLPLHTHFDEDDFSHLSHTFPTFHTHRNHILRCYPKEHLLIPLIRHFHSTPPLTNNPDQEPNKDSLSETFKSHSCPSHKTKT